MKKLTSILLVLSLCTSLYGCSRMGTNIYNGLNNKRLETKSTGLDNTCINWFFIPNNESRTPDINDKLNFKLSDYDAIYNGPKSPILSHCIKMLTNLKFRMMARIVIWYLFMIMTILRSVVIRIR